MVRNAKLCLPNHIVVRGADWFKCHFWQLYFKADWLEIHFLSEDMSLVSGLHVQRSNWQQSLIKILSWREREGLKQLKKILAQPQLLAYVQLVQL